MNTASLISLSITMSQNDSPLLPFTDAPDILFLFGLAGSGKSYVGDLLAACSDYTVYHADKDITPAMHQALAEQRPFTDAMRDEFFAQLIEKIRQLRTAHPRLVITQAVYKQRHRDLLQQNIAGMAMIWVTASDAVIDKRLQARTQGISPASAAALRRDFEIPPQTTNTIINDSDDEALIRQLNGLYSSTQ